MHWGKVTEPDLESETGIRKVRLINDFVANGYGMIKLKEQDIYQIFSPDEGVLEDKVRLVIGIGTGLGACTLVRPDEEHNFYVYSSEPGVVNLQLYDERDHQFETFLKKSGLDGGRDDVENFLSGRGLTLVFEFLASNWLGELSLLLKSKGEEGVKGEDITSFAEKENDPLCLATLNYFIEYLAKFL